MFSEVFKRFFRGTLRAPLRVPFSSQSYGPCCPCSCCPLKNSSKKRAPNTAMHLTHVCDVSWRYPPFNYSAPEHLGNGPNTVSGSTVSNTELSEFSVVKTTLFECNSWKKPFFPKDLGVGECLQSHTRFVILSGQHRMENGLQAGNGEKMENEMENRPELDRGKNGPKMAWKWRKHGKLPRIPISGPFLGHFCPCQARGGFPFRFPFFPHFRLAGHFPFCAARQNHNTRYSRAVAFAISCCQGGNSH